MNPSVIHLIGALVLAALFAYAVKRYAEQRAIWVLAFGSVVFGLVYDNLILGLGNMLGEGPALRALSAPRFWMHGVLTPLLGMFGWYLARRSGVKWAQGIGAYAVFGTITLIGTLVGINAEIISNDLVFKNEEGIMRYAHARSAPPINAILANVLAIVAGIAVGVHTRRWEFAVGAVVFFVIAASRASGLFQNIGEVLLAATAYLTERQFTGRYVPLRIKRAAAASTA